MRFFPLMLFQGFIYLPGMLLQDLICVHTLEFFSDILLSDFRWLNTVQYFMGKNIFWHISTKLNCLSCLAGLLSGSCSLLLADVQTSICVVYTRELKPYTQAIVYHRNQKTPKKRQWRSMIGWDIGLFFFGGFELDAKAEEQCADSKAEEQCADRIFKKY